ncbi:unnamed protein product [Owenia fusiformis]|uniref:Uncharacterized protein n=1 Tax=Owenia fusiformis TaxID=6347 RepID=A0A8J1TW97_OWEFU|nr:unnamed protein product [Owenia fusiformis]
MQISLCATLGQAIIWTTRAGLTPERYQKHARRLFKMRLPRLTCSLALTLMCISLHHNIQEVQGNWAALGKVLFAGVTSTLSIASWASEGCLYFQEICAFKESIPELENRAKGYTQSLSADANALKALYESNVDLYNLIYSATIKNERIIGSLKAIEKYSHGILKNLVYIANVDIPAMDLTPGDVEKTKQEFNRIANQIETVEKAANRKKIRDGLKRFRALTGTGIMYGNIAYNYFNPGPVSPVSPAPARELKTKLSLNTATGLKQRINSMTKYMANYPRFSNAVNAAVFGTKVLMAGIGIALDVKNARRYREKLSQIQADLESIIADYETNRARLDTLLQDQRNVQSDGEAELGNVEETFLQNTEYLDILRSSRSSSQDAELLNVPLFTASSVNKDNIIDNQNIYIDYLTTRVDELKAVYSRVDMIKFITQFVQSPTQAKNQIPLSVLIMIAEGMDPTVTRDIVLYTIADALPNTADWPDMDPTTGTLATVNLAPYRGVS